MKCRVVVLAISTIFLLFSQIVINAEATTVSAYSSTTPTQADPQSEFLCKAFLPLCFR